VREGVYVTFVHLLDRKVELYRGRTVCWAWLVYICSNPWSTAYPMWGAGAARLQRRARHNKVQQAWDLFSPLLSMVVHN
jgi:hypothetical protein